MYLLIGEVDYGRMTDSMTEVSQTDYSLDTRGKKMRTLVLRL